tara:strand:- start:897 stop:2621 length:1725 start_codon:yes stop_codon:yes gene_type:complete
MGADPAERFGGSPTKGIGAKPVSRPFERGSTYDEVPTPTPSKPKDPSNIEKVKNKFIDLMKSFGAEDPKEEKVDGKAVYKGPMFTNTPIDIDAQMARIRDAVDYSKAPPLVYTAYGSTYDEIPPFSANKNLVKNAVNTFLKQRGLGGKEYTIKRGDTLSEIAQREGVTVDDLVKINKIKDKDRIYTGETLIIPPTQEIERVKDLVDSVDPDAQFSQSGVPMDQRIFEPELGYDEIPLPSQATVDKKIAGLGARPEVTVTELDDTYVAAEDTTRTSDTPSAPTPDYATMSFGEAGRPDTGDGIMTKPKLRPGTKKSEKELVQRTLQDLGYGTLEDKKGNFDGIIGKGSQRAIRKFQTQHGLAPTGDLDQTTYNMIISGESDAYPDPRQEIPADQIESITSDVGDFEVMKKALAKIESGPHGYTVYKFDIKDKKGNIIHKAGDLLYGGSGNHYLGKYQMGEDALSDVGVGYSKAEREAFLKDPVAQDKAFKEYTENNHKKLTRESERYRNMTKEEKLGVLGYAHNQGATAAIEWLFTGVSGADANGTKGTKYTTKIAEAFADPSAAAVREFYEVTP